MRGVWRFGHGLVGCDLRQGSRCEADQVRWLRQITATLLALVCLVSFAAAGHGVAAVSGPPAMSDDDLVDAQLNWLLDEIDYGSAERMQTLFPEGYFFTVVLTGLAATGPAAPGDERATRIGYDTLALADSPTGTAPFTGVASPPHGAFHAGWTLLLAVQNARLSTDRAAVEDVRRRARALLAAFAASNTGLLESYPGQTWPCDSVVAMAALHEAARLVQLGGLQSTTQRWLAQLDAVRDPATGLLAHRTTPSATVLAGPRATSQSIVQAFWPSIVGAEAARAEWSTYVETFVDRRLGVVGVREYPPGVAGVGDIDSGPLLLGLSASASVVTLAAARAHGDQALATDLDRGAELVGSGVTVLGQRRYAAGRLPVGDAFLVWARTRPWTVPDVETLHPRPVWTVPIGIIAAPGLLALAALAAGSGRARKLIRSPSARWAMLTARDRRVRV